MSLRRQSLAAAVLATALFASPAVSAAAPGDAGRAALPPAAYNAELPEPDEASSRAPAGRALADSARAPDAIGFSGDRTMDALVGVSTYVDECERPTGDLHDIRRLEMGRDDDDVLLTMRPCNPASLDDIDDETLQWTTTTTDTGDTHEIVVTGPPTGSNDALELRVDDDRVGAPDGGARLWTDDTTGVRFVLVRFPSALLGLQDSQCSPTSGVACLNLRFDTLAPSGTVIDSLPNRGIRLPQWPSRCGSDVDPAAVGHVRLTTTSTATARDAATALEAAGYRAYPYPDLPHVEVPVGASDTVVDVLETWDEVVEVTPVTPRRMLDVTPDDPQYERQWYLPAIGAPSAWETSKGKEDVGIAIVDNGVAGDHEAFGSRVVDGWDSLTNDTIDRRSHSDLGGHGTAVAGLAAATGNDGIGVAGVDWNARIVPVRVFDHEGCFVPEPAKYYRALDWIADEAKAGRIDVVNFSLGGPAIAGEAERIERIVDNGAVVVAAMGNDRSEFGSPTSFPAALPDVIAVGATGPDDQIAGYSNEGRHLDMVAPGGDQSENWRGDIWTMADPTVVGESTPFTAQAGTSFSSPLVAGIAALYRAEYPGSTPADVVRALLTTARDLGADQAGFDMSYGFGMADAPRALRHSPGQTLVRLAGGDRYETAAIIARHAFPEPGLVDTVLLATGEKYPDALAGGPLAAREHAPLLLTPGGGLHGATRDALRALDPDRVLLLGGTSVLSPAVADDLQRMGFEVGRAAGGDRYDTAKAIALGTGDGSFSWRAWNSAPVVFLATGQNFPDALPGGAAAAANDAPLLLTGRTHLPPATIEALDTLDTRQVVVLGGPTAVDDNVLNQLSAMRIEAFRSEGGDRYETAAVTASCRFMPCQAGTRFVVVATGEGFADALGGSAAAAALRAPLLLVPRSGEVPRPVVDAMRGLEPEQAIVLGGPVPISGEMADDVGNLVVK